MSKPTGIDYIAQAREELESSLPMSELKTKPSHQLSQAAACYCIPHNQRFRFTIALANNKPVMSMWPRSLDVDHFKTDFTNPIEELAYAGALIAAEIDRMLNANILHAASSKSNPKQPTLEAFEMESIKRAIKHISKTQTSIKGLASYVPEQRRLLNEADSIMLDLGHWQKNLQYLLEYLHICDNYNAIKTNEAIQLHHAVPNVPETE